MLTIFETELCLYSLINACKRYPETLWPRIIKEELASLELPVHMISACDVRTIIATGEIRLAVVQYVATNLK